MFVLEGDDPDPWAADFTLKGELNTYDQFAIDGTYFIHNQQIYHIYSCWQEQTSAWPANLCITHMSDPWTVDTNLSDRRMISVPNEPWERVPYGRPDTRLATNEGPQQLVNPTTGQNFVVYSAARVNTPFYCLGEGALHTRSRAVHHVHSSIPALSIVSYLANGSPGVTDPSYPARSARACRQ